MPETDGKVETHDIRQYRLNDCEGESFRVLAKDLQCAPTIRLAVRLIAQGFKHLSGRRADGFIVIHDQYAM
jgi:hypothetical protein